MLRSMQLENFKAFGQRTTIPLAPITLILGQNSSGKSSILQSLNLLKQTRQSRDAESLLLPRTDNGIVDLGSFQEMLFDHELKRSLTIRLDVALGKDQRHGNAPRVLRQATSLGLELSFARKKSEDEVTLERFNLCGEDLNSTIATFEKCDSPGKKFRSEGRRGSKLSGFARCCRIGDDASYWKPAYEWVFMRTKRLLSLLKDAKEKVRQESPERALFNEYVPQMLGGESLFAALDDYSRFISNGFTYNEFVERMIREQLNEIVSLDGFIPTDIEYAAPGYQGLDALLNQALGPQRFADDWSTGRFDRDWSLGIGTSAIYAGSVVEDSLAALFPLGPFRKPPSRWYVFTGTTPKDVGYEGHLLPNLLFRQQNILEDTNEWLRRLEIGYEIKIRNLGDRLSDLFELRLVDSRRKKPVEVGLLDVGFGISQILPFVVQSLAASDQIISVEQPEVHIHPRLQADLGDLLIEAIKEPRRNQFIIETHSEHLALRLQRRVREKILSPNEISIVYVSRGPNGATVQPLRLDDEGDFMDDFPGGFFPERLRELR